MSSEVGLGAMTLGTEVKVISVRKSKSRLEKIRGTMLRREREGATARLFGPDDLEEHDVVRTTSGFNVLWDTGSKKVVGIVHYRWVACETVRASTYVKEGVRA